MLQLHLCLNYSVKHFSLVSLSPILNGKVYGSLYHQPQCYVFVLWPTAIILPVYIRIHVVRSYCFYDVSAHAVSHMACIICVITLHSDQV